VQPLIATCDWKDRAIKPNTYDKYIRIPRYVMEIRLLFSRKQSSYLLELDAIRMMASSTSENLKNKLNTFFLNPKMPMRWFLAWDRRPPLFSLFKISAKCGSKNLDIVFLPPTICPSCLCCFSSGCRCYDFVHISANTILMIFSQNAPIYAQK
jgi:hypothetical protein